MESLTNDMEKKIWDMVTEIEAKGDPAELSDKGWFKGFFDDVMARYSRQIQDGELPKVGLNIHQIPDEEDTLLKDVAEKKIEPCWERIDGIKNFKQNRDQTRVKDVLVHCYEMAKIENENLTYPTMKAMEAGATIGEIAGVMRMAYDFPYDPHGLLVPPIQI
jgi:methylmalonyl-CoA mutase N-terminal domain/subunit